MNIQILNTKNLKPTLNISSKLYTELLQQIKTTDLETTFILHIEKVDDNNYEVINYYFPPQWNEPAESKTLDSDYPKWCFELVKSQVKLNGHLHTHPKFSTSPSGYDNKFFENLANETKSYQFRLIMNHNGFIHCDLIDAINNLIFTNISVIVNCRGFNLEITSNTINPLVTDFNNLLTTLNKDLSIDLLDNDLQFNVRWIKITPTVELQNPIKTTRRSQTNESLTSKFTEIKTNKQFNHYMQKQTSIYDFITEDPEEPWGTQEEIDAYNEYLKYYDMEHGYGD